MQHNIWIVSYVVKTVNNYDHPKLFHFLRIMKSQNKKNNQNNQNKKNKKKAKAKELSTKVQLELKLIKEKKKKGGNRKKEVKFSPFLAEAELLAGMVPKKSNESVTDNNNNIDTLVIHQTKKQKLVKKNNRLFAKKNSVKDSRCKKSRKEAAKLFHDKIKKKKGADFPKGLVQEMKKTRQIKKRRNCKNK